MFESESYVAVVCFFDDYWEHCDDVIDVGCSVFWFDSVIIYYYYFLFFIICLFNINILGKEEKKI